MIDTPLLSALMPEGGGTQRKEADHTVRAALLATEKSERQAIVEAYIRNELARVLRMDPSRIDPAKRLTALGLDSLMAYELKARIESDMGVGLPMVKLVGGPSISELAAYLTAQVEATAVSTGTATAPQPAPPAQAPDGGGEDPILSELDHLSDEQVDSMLSDFSVDEQEALREDRP
jgi:acyl carrier protein